MRTLLILLLLAGTASAQMYPFPGRPGMYAAGGGGQQITEDFSGTIDWTERGSASLSFTAGEFVSDAVAYRAEHPTRVDTRVQYAAAQWVGGAPDSPARYSGPVLRADDGETTSDFFYTFRFNTTGDFSLRACESVSACTDVTSNPILTTEIGDGTAMGDNDSIGFSVDSGTGDDVKFRVWKWENQAPPTDYSTWGSADRTVCETGCSESWGAGDSPVDLGRAADDGKGVGLYSGSGTTTGWDNFVGGDWTE